MSVLESLVEAVQNGEEAEAIRLARQAIEGGLQPHEIIEGLTAGMRVVGDRFAAMEIFLVELMMAARTMQAVMKEIEPELKRSSTIIKKKGTIVIGTVKGDMHEIGKNIVISLLEVQGFEVHDMGVNVDALDFVRKAEEVNADIIGISALMTTTMPLQKDVIDILTVKGVRNKYHVILGGAPVTLEWVQTAGADSWGENAGKSVQILEKAMQERRK